jgi:hypothetical protein
LSHLARLLASEALGLVRDVAQNFGRHIVGYM